MTDRLFGIITGRMRSSLELGAPPALSTLQRGNGIALFLDFDGTLVKLAPTPDTILPLHDLAKRLEGLALRLGGACALVSGRAIDDIEAHIGPLSLAMAGSHGADLRTAEGVVLGAPAKALPAAMEEELKAFAASRAIDFEKKPHGGALHYRANPDMGGAADAFATGLAEKHGWTVQRGKCVVELVAGTNDKGSAVTAIMQQPQFSGRTPIFVGDDLTDEAGFVACMRLGGFGVLVGAREGTNAHYGVSAVGDVHSWLEL